MSSEWDEYVRFTQRRARMLVSATMTQELRAWTKMNKQGVRFDDAQGAGIEVDCIPNGRIGWSIDRADAARQLIDAGLYRTVNVEPLFDLVTWYNGVVSEPMGRIHIEPIVIK